MENEHKPVNTKMDQVEGLRELVNELRAELIKEKNPAQTHHIYHQEYRQLGITLSCHQNRSKSFFKS